MAVAVDVDVDVAPERGKPTAPFPAARQGATSRRKSTQEGESAPAQVK